MDILVGQIWLDNKSIWSAGYKGEMLYIVGSGTKEIYKGELIWYWKCYCFQEWTFGAYERTFTGKELNKLIYIGRLTDFRKP